MRARSPNRRFLVSAFRGNGADPGCPRGRGSAPAKRGGRSQARLPRPTPPPRARAPGAPWPRPSGHRSRRPERRRKSLLVKGPFADVRDHRLGNEPLHRSTVREARAHIGRRHIDAREIEPAGGESRSRFVSQQSADRLERLPPDPRRGAMTGVDSARRAAASRQRGKVARESEPNTKNNRARGFAAATPSGCRSCTRGRRGAPRDRSLPTPAPRHCEARHREAILGAGGAPSSAAIGPQPSESGGLIRADRALREPRRGALVDRIERSPKRPIRWRLAAASIAPILPEVSR